jgi:hypothetical protein
VEDLNTDIASLRRADFKVLRGVRGKDGDVSRIL